MKVSCSLNFIWDLGPENGKTIWEWVSPSQIRISGNTFTAKPEVCLLDVSKSSQMPINTNIIDVYHTSAYKLRYGTNPVSSSHLAKFILSFPYLNLQLNRNATVTMS